MMKPYVPAAYLNKIWRAIIEFDMLSAGDKILIGLSGGKDSMFLTAALSEVQRHAPVHFELACYTVDTKFSPDFPAQKLHDFCIAYGLTHYHEEVDVLSAWKKRGNTPCFSCAYFRRAATNRKALELGYNKIALAHHHDDAVETFLLSLFNSGQLKTFLPSTYLTRTQLTVLRPLIYYRETEIIDYVHSLGIIPLKNPCPYDGHTKRQEMKEFLKKIQKINPQVYEHLAAAQRESSGSELWPAVLDEKTMIEKFRTFWKKQTKEGL